MTQIETPLDTKMFEFLTVDTRTLKRDDLFESKDRGLQFTRNVGQ